MEAFSRLPDISRSDQFIQVERVWSCAKDGLAPGESEYADIAISERFEHPDLNRRSTFACLAFLCSIYCVSILSGFGIRGP